MTYRCEFPGCDYATNQRNNICMHHINPRSKVKNNNIYNTIWLCPTHHTFIYIPMKNGIHSVYNKDSIIIHKKLMSSNGIILEYQYVENDRILYCKI